MNPARISVKAVVVVDGQLLAVHFENKDGPYYMLPGGGQEVGETLADAMRRECLEEIGADVKLGPVLWIRDYREANHEFVHRRPDFHQVEVMFECQLAGEPDMGATGDVHQIGLAWIPLREIEQWPFWPKSLRATLAAGLPATGATYLGDVN